MKPVSHLVPGELVVPPRQYKDMRRIIKIDSLEFMNNRWVLRYQPRHEPYAYYSELYVDPEKLNNLLFIELHELNHTTQHLCGVCLDEQSYYMHLTQLEVYWLRFADADYVHVYSDSSKASSEFYRTRWSNDVAEVRESLDDLDKVMGAVYQYASGAQPELIFRFPY